MMLPPLSTSFVLLLIALCSGTEFLTIDKSSNKFKYNGKEVFLSGANQAWSRYGNDFGNKAPNGVFCGLNETLSNISVNGGNSVREWLFVDGSNIPEFNSEGEVVSTDAAGTLIDDLKRYLQSAAKQNIFVFLTLWNGAVALSPQEIGIITNSTKLTSFIDHALVPMVTALADEPALGGYEIINEPCGSIQVEEEYDGQNVLNSDCIDTKRYLSGSGAGWTKSNIPMLEMQRFINVQTAAIHKTDPKALVTVGIWNERAGTEAFGYFNFFSDKCLMNAGGEKKGTLDFQQFHTYAFNGKYGDHSPFHQKSSDYQLTVPLVIGEFENQLTEDSYPTEYEYLHQNGYNGAWAWSMNTEDNNGWKHIDGGLEVLKGKKDVGVVIKGGMELEDRCWCSDHAPDQQYSCEQQAEWGKCEQAFMKGYCCKSCKACRGCN